MCNVVFVLIDFRYMQLILFTHLYKRILMVQPINKLEILNFDLIKIENPGYFSATYTITLSEERIMLHLK